jgi:hypothetical protein
MDFQVGDILSVSLAGHTRHFFVYIGNGSTVGWGPKNKKHFLDNEGIVEWKSLLESKSRYFWQESNQLKEITLERRTNLSLERIETRINQITPGLTYHLVHRNCEHFANYVTAQDIRSEQSAWHLFTDYVPFSTEPTIKTLKELKSALLKCKFSGDLILNKKDFENAISIQKLLDGYYVYYLNHWSTSQQLYVTTISKADNFLASYNSICLTYYGVLLGRGEILNIVRQLRGC